MTPASSDESDAMFVWVSGDTWQGVPSVTITNRVAPGDLASVKLAFKLNPKATTPALELTSGGGGITITDAANWIFTVDSGRYDLPVGKNVWQLETSDDSSPAYVETLWQGVGEVLPNYTSTT